MILFMTGEGNEFIDFSMVYLPLSEFNEPDCNSNDALIFLILSRHPFAHANVKF